MNDDLPSLGGETPLDVALTEGRQIGYQGFELGNKFPREPQALKTLLAQYDLALVSGWYSGRLARRSVEEEIASVGPHLELLAQNGATAMVYGEVADSIQGAPQPLYQRPRFFGDAQWAAYAARVDEFARYTLSRGVRLAYHHHMGAYVETPADVDQLMSRTSDAVGLLFDAGHITFAGGDPLAVLDKHIGARVSRALQGRAAGGDEARAQPQLEFSRRGDQRRVHRAGRRRGGFPGDHRASEAAGLSRLAGGRSRTGPGGRAIVRVCEERLHGRCDRWSTHRSTPWTRPGRRQHEFIGEGAARGPDNRAGDAGVGVLAVCGIRRVPAGRE